MRTAFMIALGVISIALVVVVMIQSSKSEGLSSTLGGNSADQLFGTKKSQGKEAILNKLTVALGVVFVALNLVLLVIE